MNAESRIVLRQMARLAVNYSSAHMTPKKRARILRRLVRTGHVEMERKSRGPSTRRNVYTLTAKGMKAAYMLDRRSKRRAEPWVHAKSLLGMPYHWKRRQEELDRP